MGVVCMSDDQMFVFTKSLCHHSSVITLTEIDHRFGGFFRNLVHF